jgi:hypothetical protein
MFFLPRTVNFPLIHCCRMKKLCIFLLLQCCLIQGFSWGFFGHKMINRLAVFTLPEQLLGFYKEHIEYITEHSVDPDKRRYSVPEEACRHYIDLDHFEAVVPIDTVPRLWKDAVAKYTEDTLNAYGIVPWHISSMKYRLTEAFRQKDVDQILKVSTEIGHYIADAHVPLHATENYNGQMSGQHGIHGFWESRLPELFSNEYDFFAGRAVYVDDPLGLAWRASEGSFAAKDSVLLFERQLNETFPSDQKYTQEIKGQKEVKVYSTAYSAAYHKKLGGQVERRMQMSILAVGSIWYTCWVDAGQPDLAALGKKKKKLSDADRAKMMAEEQQLLQQRMIGREE